MKKVLSATLLFTASIAFAQQEHLTKIYFKVKANCSCTFRFERNGKPAGQSFQMDSDSLSFAVDSTTTGFYIHCGKGDTSYLPIPYRPGQGFWRIYGTMGCEAKEENTFSVQPMKI